MDRNVAVSFRLQHPTDVKVISKSSWRQEFKFEQKGEIKVMQHTLEDFSILRSPKSMRSEGFSENIFIDLDITH